MSENSPVKTPRLPRFFLICIHSVSSPSASCLLTSLPRLPLPLPLFPPSLPHYPLPPPHTHTFFSVLLCLSSSCIASPAPWCGTGNQNSAHIRTCTRRLIHTHTHVTHAQGDTRPPLPAAPLPPFYTLTPLHCRHETFYNRWCASSSSRDIVNTTSNQHSAITHTHTMWHSLYH